MNFTVQSNKIYNNNFAGYSYYWEAGGAKFANATTVVIRYNYPYDNAGPGLWNDINSEGVTYDENETFGNTEAGILRRSAPISPSAVTTFLMMVSTPPEPVHGGAPES